ncbi:MAG: UDP-N-acetylmuramate dehydrogenase [bacterium]
MSRHPDRNREQATVKRIRTAIDSLRGQFPAQLLVDVPLRELTTFRIGGPALGVGLIQTHDDARKFQAIAAEHDLPLAFLGDGSNVLADDRGFCGLILKMEVPTFEIHGDTVTVGAGVRFDNLIERCLAAGLVGLEFASGIPGTVGGAVVGNAGCYGHEISEFLVAATVLRADGRLETVGPEDLVFSYRNSRLKGSTDLLLEAELQLRQGDNTAALQARQEHLASRGRKHPVHEPCAGSYFQNLPPRISGGKRRAAGELLEAVGAKEMQVGGAAVFAKHANIIINADGASCRDVQALAARMRTAVADRFEVQLQEEVRYLSWC